jgi:hypothetical protein
MMTLSDIDFKSLTREEIISLIDARKLNKAALLHWDICNERKNTTIVMLADKLNISEDLIKGVQRCKCR